MKYISDCRVGPWQKRVHTGAWAGYFLASETWSLLSLVGRFSRPDMSACANMVSDIIVEVSCADLCDVVCGMMCVVVYKCTGAGRESRLTPQF
jgi:hypothetical protein